ncbi:Inorganic triphosphatase YgiF, contains CYTH and CHAD domains [Phyllobacterium sp. YR620]|nr:Inorganic triphosphatase YgiF, contains CYTH and CHAD domains [Phyllobacterium sp. YR620]
MFSFGPKGVKVASVETITDKPRTSEQKPPVETELKLLVAVERFAAFRESALQRLSARNKGIIRRLDAIYFDTPDHALFDAGLTLRVRRTGRSFTQTVKRMASNGALSRHEWETPVHAMAPDLGSLPLLEIGPPFDKLDPQLLVPAFATNVRRHALMVDVPGAQIEVAFDDGKVEAGAWQQPISEVELELKQGRPAALYELGLSLMETEPLRLGVQTKSDRGYALACIKTPKAFKATQSGIGRDDIVDDAIAALLGNCHQQILANLVPAELSEVPDGVHQLRVGLRRLRTLLWLLRHEIGAPALASLEAEAKQLASNLGPARNWEVFISSTIANLETVELEDIDFSGLRMAAHPFRDEAYVKVREVLASPGVNRFLLSLGLVIEQRNWRNDISAGTLGILSEPVGKLGARVLGRIERKALKLGRHFRHLEPGQRHKVRITLKKLRYALEFFLPLYAGHGATGKYLKRLSHLQDSLGAENDIATSRELLHQVSEATTDPGVHRAIGAVAGWQRCYQISKADQLLSDWKNFERQPLFSD